MEAELLVLGMKIDMNTPNTINTELENNYLIFIWKLYKNILFDITSKSLNEEFEAAKEALHTDPMFHAVYTMNRNYIKQLKEIKNDLQKEYNRWLLEM